MAEATSYNPDRMQQLIREAPAWYRTPSLIKLYFLTLAPLITSAAWGFDISLTNGLQSLDYFMDHFDHPSGSTLGFFGAASSVGGIVSCLISGPLTERFGRRIMVSAGAALIIGMAIMQIFSVNFGMFIAGKVLIGVAGFFQQVAAPVLVAELAHPKQRAAISALYNTNIFIGLIIGAWVTFGTYPMKSEWSWKIPCLLQAAIPVYQVGMVWLTPESPRWLISKGRVEEARAILIKYHGGGVETEIVRLELQEIIAGIESDKTMMKFNLEGLKSMIGTKGNRHRLWLCAWTAIGSQSIGGGFTASYLPLILDQIGMRSSKQKTLINALMNIFNFLCAFLSAIIIPKVGRRTIFLISAGGINITFIVWTILSALYLQDSRLSLAIGVLVAIFCVNFFVCICWIPLVIAYPIETVTTKQRGVFLAFTLLTINCTAVPTSYLAPIGIGALGWRYYIPTCVWNVIMFLVIYFTFIETSGRTLEEISVLFDKDESFENAAAAVGKEMDEKDGHVITTERIEKA